MLTRCQSQVGGEVSARAESVEVTDEGNESGGRQDADARHAHEEGRLRHRPGVLLELRANAFSLGVKLLDLVEHVAEGVTQEAGQIFEL